MSRLAPCSGKLLEILGQDQLRSFRIHRIAFGPPVGAETPVGFNNNFPMRYPLIPPLPVFELGLEWRFDNCILRWLQALLATVAALFWTTVLASKCKARGVVPKLRMKARLIKSALEKPQAKAICSSPFSLRSIIRCAASTRTWRT